MPEFVEDRLLQPTEKRHFSVQQQQWMDGNAFDHATWTATIEAQQPGLEQDLAQLTALMVAESAKAKLEYRLSDRLKQLDSGVSEEKRQTLSDEIKTAQQKLSSVLELLNGLYGKELLKLVQESQQNPGSKLTREVALLKIELAVEKGDITEEFGLALKDNLPPESS